MKKIILSTSVIATMAIAGGDLGGITNFEQSDATMSEIEALKERIGALEAQKAQAKDIKKDDSSSKKITDLEKKVKRLNKKLNKVRAHDAFDNIKLSADLRTGGDAIEYKMADGSKVKNNDLFSNRLWINMAYNPSDNLIFTAQLGYNKAYGADWNGRGQGYDSVDWITNEALTNDTIKLRKAFWLYMGDDFLGTNIPWTASLGRRPSTTGFLANFREDDKAQSPLGHNVDLEFDGGSMLFKLGKLTGVSGMSFKVCAGQGATNASPRFSNTGTDYANDSTALEDTRLAGFIFVPYDDGTIKVMTNGLKAFNLPGMTMNANGIMQQNFSTKGDEIGGVVSVLVDGLDELLGAEDSDFLADTKVFASYAYSQTDPDNGQTMLGSTDKESGSSIWFGTQMPVMGGQLGLEYNKGSKYWRSFTYGEDTMIGSKIATRGTAIEAYYTHKLTKALSAQIRYTKIDYDYTGSNGFFGDGGTPMKISDAKSAGLNPVESAQDIRAYIRYRF
jgi:Cu/Ag efflux protein CusF